MQTINSIITMLEAQIDSMKEARIDNMKRKFFIKQRINLNKVKILFKKVKAK